MTIGIGNYDKGYNQSQLPAKSLANELGIPMLNLASKQKYTVFHLHLNHSEKQKNLKGMFCVEDLSQVLNGATILLLDDVTTTGSILLELTKTVHESRNDLNFRGAVIARNMG